MTGTILFLAATWFVFRRIREGETGLGVRFLIMAVVVMDLAFYHPSVGINFNIVKSEKEFGPDPSAVTGEMAAIAQDLAGLSRDKPGRILIGMQGVRTPWERNVSQSAFYRYRVQFLLSHRRLPGTPATPRLLADGLGRETDRHAEGLRSLGGSIFGK